MFRGVYTALVTPFLADKTFDEAAFARLIERQIAGGVDGLVVLGTTGESPTVPPAEHELVLRKALEIVDGRLTLIAGAGSNSTQEAIKLSKEAEAMGYHGLLQVNPYYNKPNQEGLFQHFNTIADSVDIPIMLYNIAGRCGVNLETPTLLRLAQHPNIVAVKEASGNLEQMQAVLEQVPPEFTVLSGDDNLTLKLMKLGGHGVVSVLSNALPEAMKALVRAAGDEDWETAQTQHDHLADLFGACFIEPNPQPIKTLLAEMGLCQADFRLPMVNMAAENKEKLVAVWQNYKTQ